MKLLKHHIYKEILHVLHMNTSCLIWHVQSSHLWRAHFRIFPYCSTTLSSGKCGTLVSNQKFNSPFTGWNIFSFTLKSDCGVVGWLHRFRSILVSLVLFFGLWAVLFFQWSCLVWQWRSWSKFIKLIWSYQSKCYKISELIVW